LPDLLSTAAIVSSGIWRARAHTRSTTSASVAQRDWPARLRFTTRRLWSPPCQWMTRSKWSPTLSTMISWITVRMIFLRVSGVAPGLSHALARSSPRSIRRSRSAAVLAGSMLVSSWSISNSRLCTAVRRSFHRRSSSPATRRFSGSAASYWRCALAAA